MTDGGTRYVCTGYTLDGNTVNGQTSVDVTMNSDHTLTWNWKIQYYLTIKLIPAFGSKSGEGWYDAGATADWSVSPLIQPYTPGIRYVANPPTSGQEVMDGPKTITATWKTQYYLTVNSVRGDPQGAGWYDEGTTASWSVTSPVVDGGTRYVANQASGTVVMNYYQTVNVNWSTEYYLTTIADPQTGGTVTPAGGWYAAGSSVQIQAFPNQAWTFSTWSGDASGNQNPSSIVMDSAKTVRAIFTAVAQNTISGKVYRSDGSVFPGVTIEYSGTWNGQIFSGSLLTGADGSYSISVPKGWTGTVTAKNTSSMFTPTSRAYTSISTNQTNQDFTALGGYTISGYVVTSAGKPIVGAIINFGGYGTCTTGATGYYTKTVSAGWSGTVTSYRPGYKFTPASRTYSNVLKNYSNQNFTGTL